MPEVCDFVHVTRNPITIGDRNRVYEHHFGTGGRNSRSSGFIILNVSGLTHSDGSVVVSINGVEIGRIQNYRPGGAGISQSDGNQAEKWRQAHHWYTQMIAFDGTRLRDGSNTLQIEAVDFPEDSASNRFDDFQVKDVVCFFHQNA
ncbi:hypothetical protein [Parasulfitobacter algicola]|uniref:hypothetical protein n=1 Tax=Parasulfitobacter algicola TaxID=2614809 RepID=UPI001574B3F1|nr:hypothetical protein [Sulfitobacter algicola]